MSQEGKWCDWSYKGPGKRTNYKNDAIYERPQRSNRVWTFFTLYCKKKKKITKQRDLNFETFVDFHFVFDFWKTFTVFFLLNIRNFVRKIKKENHFWIVREKKSLIEIVVKPDYDDAHEMFEITYDFLFFFFIPY